MEKLNPRLAALDSKKDAVNLAKVLGDIYNRLSSVTLKTGTLAISATTTLAKTTNATILSAQGIIRSFAAADLPVLSGIITTGYQNVAVFSVDKAGTAYTQMGTQATTLAGVKFPNVPSTRAVLGFVIIANATGSDFTCNTTALSAVSVTTTYVDTLGAFDPNAVLA
jgi:hypothetical protein